MAARTSLSSSLEGLKQARHRQSRAGRSTHRKARRGSLIARSRGRRRQQSNERAVVDGAEAGETVDAYLVANLSCREFVSCATKHHGVVRLIAVHEQDRRGLATLIAE